MKKIFFILTIVSLGLTSCTDESTFSNPSHHQLSNGSFLRFADDGVAASYPDPQDILISESIYDANGNTSSYSLTVTAVLSGSLVVAEDFLTITSFPATLNLTTQSLGEALGVDPTTITYGDTFNFVAKSMRNDGTMFYGQAPSFDDSTNTVGLGNTESNLTNVAAYKSAMSFGFIVSCPFVQAEMLGTYNVVFDDGFYGFLQDGVFEVVAGANANQIIMLDPYGSAYSPLDIVVDVDDFGIATVDRQAAFGTNEVCCNGYSLTYVATNNTSLALSCIGYIDLQLSTGLGITPSTSGYTFGDIRFIAQKQ